MPERKVIPDIKAKEIKDEKDIKEIEEIIFKTLNMLIGPDSHKAGISGVMDAIFKSKTSSLGNALKVGMGVTLDHWHMGYKEIAMQSFGNGLQKIFKQHFIALKLLENDTNALRNNEELKEILEGKDRKYILKMMGLNKEERKDLEDKDFDQTVEYLQENFKNKPEKRSEQIQKIEFMLNGAMSYLPFSEPYDGKKFDIPLKGEDGKYQLVQNQVEKINMLPGIEGPYYAIKLNPINTDQYFKKHTLFMGTNPLPTAPGSIATFFSDTIRKKNVGQNLIEGSRDTFEALYKMEFKENVKRLLLLAMNDENNIFRKENGEIDYEKIWLDARIKCAGQSLGGSLSLQMYVKYPYMIECEAFEPPLLLEKERNEMEKNIINARHHFSLLVDELKNEMLIENENLLKKNEVLLNQGEAGNSSKNIENNLNEIEKNIKILESSHLDSLKESAIPKDISDLKKTLTKSNKIIIQMIDIVTKYGTFFPPADIFKIDTKKVTGTYNKITNAAYRFAMAGTVMSHAMSLGGKAFTTYSKKTPEDFDWNKRKTFTGFLHQLWRLPNPVLSGYFNLKYFYLQNVHNPQMNPSKSKAFLEKNKENQLEKIDALWSVIEENIRDLDKPDTWAKGQHLYDKIQKLHRDISRVEALKIDVNMLLIPIEDKDVEKFNNIKKSNENIDKKISLINEKIYALKSAMSSTESSPVKQYFIKLLEDSKHNFSLEDSQINNKLDKYVKELKSLRTVDNIDKSADELKRHRKDIIEYYSLLPASERMKFINHLSSKIDQITTPNIRLLSDLFSHGKSSRERREIKKLMKKQEGVLKMQIKRIPPNVRSIISKNHEKNDIEILRRDFKILERSLNSLNASYNAHGVQKIILISKMRDIRDLVLVKENSKEIVPQNSDTRRKHIATSFELRHEAGKKDNSRVLVEKDPDNKKKHGKTMR